MLKAVPSLAGRDTPHILVRSTEAVRIFAVSDQEQCVVVNAQQSCCVRLAPLATVAVASGSVWLDHVLQDILAFLLQSGQWILVYYLCHLAAIYFPGNCLRGLQFAEASRAGFEKYAVWMPKCFMSTSTGMVNKNTKNPALPTSCGLPVSVSGQGAYTTLKSTTLRVLCFRMVEQTVRYFRASCRTFPVFSAGDNS